MFQIFWKTSRFLENVKIFRKFHFIIMFFLLCQELLSNIKLTRGQKVRSDNCIGMVMTLAAHRATLSREPKSCSSHTNGHFDSALPSCQPQPEMTMIAKFEKITKNLQSRERPRQLKSSQLKTVPNLQQRYFQLSLLLKVRQCSGQRVCFESKFS